jgi:thiol-disulfide isomerase/thioredoxin
MICIIALVVFAFMGLFSARYRPFAKEAFHCVFLRATLRPCHTGFDQRMKAKITGKLFKRSPRTAGFVHRHFEAISWFFTAIMFISLGYTAYGLYNLVVFGTCDPVTGQCPFNWGYVPGKNITNSVPENVTFIEFWSPVCPNCKKMEPIVAQVENKTGIKFERFDVYNNETARKVFFEHVDEIEKTCGIAGTPTFYSVVTHKFTCGVMSAERLEQWVLGNCK